MAVTRVRRSPGVVDVYGDPVTSIEDRTVLEDCLIAPTGRDVTDARGRDGLVATAELYGPAGLDLADGDLLDVDGDLYTVEGDPQAWARPEGGRAGVVVELRRARG